MTDVILDTVVDALKLLPFLFVTYLLMEYIEHKAGDSMNRAVQKAGRFGPVIGGLLGAFPQCGFSAAASNLYSGRVISLGTLIAIYLSTSDEMLPIFISEKIDPAVILKILLIKAVTGALCGLAIDAIMHLMKHRDEDISISRLCEREHCSCEKEEGIVKPAFIHTLHIFVFVIAITFAINLLIHIIGEDTLKSFIIGYPVAGELISSLIGLIPNCAASVIITQLYLDGLISFGAMMSGLFAGAGVGLLVLFRVNNDPKQNLRIVALLYILSFVLGCIIEFSGIRV